jgi:molybdate transport system substrate-binding protein
VRRLGALVLVVALAAAGCGGGGDGGRLTVSAASSLKNALPEYQPEARYSFGGSDSLAAAIRAGARPDVFAAASTKLPAELYAARLVEKPVLFAGNRLVLAVPAGSTKVRSLADLEKPDVTIVAGSASVPVGTYTLDVLQRLPAAQSKRILANVRSKEPDVGGAIGKLTQGAADAGFVYATDVKATGGKLRAIDLPATLQPRVAYAAAVVKGTKRHDRAAKFISGLLTGDGRAALARAGFEPPPAPAP